MNTKPEALDAKSILSIYHPCMLLKKPQEHVGSHETPQTEPGNDVFPTKAIFSVSKCHMLEKVLKYDEKENILYENKKDVSYKIIPDPEPSLTSTCVLFERAIEFNNKDKTEKHSNNKKFRECVENEPVVPREEAESDTSTAIKKEDCGMNVRYLICSLSTLYLMSMVIMGALFLNECPVQPMLPYYPFVTGIIGLMVMALRTSMVFFGGYLNYHEYFSVIIMLISVHYLLEATNDPDWFINIIMCTRIFLLIWFVFSNYWFWTIWKNPFKYNQEKIYFNDDEDAPYCNYYLHTFCLVMIISMYSMLLANICYYFIIVPVQERRSHSAVHKNRLNSENRDILKEEAESDIE